MTVIGATSPAEAFRYCRDLTRRRARNFFWGLKLLPEPQRSSLFVVYAWMRRADDIVDDAVAGGAAAQRRLETFRRETEDALEGRGRGDDYVLVGLRAAAARHGLSAPPFQAMIDGQLDDLDSRRYETFDELCGYCRRVASSVGEVCISIWGYHDQAAPPLARDRGIAFQLTNILRDLVEDGRAGRVYLPAEDFRRHGLTPASLRRWSNPPAGRRFLSEQIERAESFYRRAADLEGMIEPACVPALWAMTAIYHGLLDRMRSDPAQLILGPRIGLPALNKGAIALRARLMGPRQAVR